MEKPVTYTALGSEKPITLNLNMIRRTLSQPTKKGCQPTREDLIRFMMLCRERALNPWVGDAYLIGFDGHDGPEFSLVTSIEALLKRAELNPHYRGMKSGVIVQPAGEGAKPEQREGAVTYDGETLLGGWAEVYRDDRQVPTYQAVKFSRYNTGRSYWRKNPEWMISKVGRAAALREAFPSQCGGLYTKDEMGGPMEAPAMPEAANGDEGHEEAQQQQSRKETSQQQLDALKAELAQRQRQAAEEPLPEDLSQQPPQDASVAPEDVQAEEPDDRPDEPPEDYSGPSEAELDAEQDRPPYSTDEPFELE